MKNWLKLIGVVSVSLVMVGCSGDVSKEDKEEYKRITINKEDFLNYYEDDVVLPYIYEDKNEEDLRKEMIEQLLGIQSKTNPILKTGVQKGQGIAIEMGIYSGGEIPTTTTLPKQEEVTTAKTEAKKNRDEKSLRDFSEIMSLRSESLSENNYIDETSILAKNIERRKEMVGKEKDLRDLDLWNFDDKIEKRYSEDLAELRKSIKKKRELQKSKDSVKILQEQVKNLEQEEALKKELDSLEEEHKNILNDLMEKEEKFKKKLDEDKDLTSDEKKGIKEGELQEVETKEENKEEKKEETK